MTPTEIKFLLTKYGITPRKEQGQHFLINEEIVDQMIIAGDITATTTVLEIGPGLGILTRKLGAANPQRLLAVEQDRVLAAGLQPLTAVYPQLEIVNEDIRKFYFAAHGLEELQYTVVANLPYSISSWVLRTLIEQTPRPKRSVVMIQREVAERVIAAPGQMSMLSVACQLYTTPTYLFDVPPESFYPPPRVDSSVIQLDLRPIPLSENPKRLLQIAKLGFAGKRKQLLNTLATGLHLPKTTIEKALATIGLKFDVRPQMLSIEEWEMLRKAIDAL
jgi:16S rRNA (adenine1518-N6/adenine1519-N6)-dimethyltransferase